VANVSRTVKRLKATSRSGATSIQNYDDAKARLKVERAQLSASQKALDLLIEGPRKEDIAAARHQLDALTADLEQLQVRRSDMVLTAPADGTIQSRILEQGELAGPSKPAFVLALTDPKWVRAYIPEPMLGKINLGMTARIFTDSLPGKSLDGWVGFISPVAEFTPRAVATEDLRTQLVYETRVFVKDPEDMLRLGAPVTVAVNRPAD
jgi:HlyD family secretion protein